MNQMLIAIGQQGNKDDIMFNAKKSIILVFNSGSTTNMKFELNGNEVPIGTQTKYLGYLLNTVDPKAHLKNRVSKSYAALNKLRLSGIISSQISPETRAYLFNVYIRPIINYGLENTELDPADTEHLSSVETMILKSTMSINKQCQNTSLLRSVNIKPFLENHIISKLNFYTRLLDNEFTRIMISEIYQLRIGISTLKSINEFIGVTEDLQLNFKVIKEAILHKTQEISAEIKSQIKSDPLVNELKKCFKMKNQAEYIIRILIVYSIKIIK